jgi:hypothetical protein
MTYQVDKKIPCNARPDHTLGSISTGWIGVADHSTSAAALKADAESTRSDTRRMMAFLSNGTDEICASKSGMVLLLRKGHDLNVAEVPGADINKCAQQLPCWPP